MPTNDTQTDGIEKLRKLHSVLAEDSVYEKAVPKDFNEFVKKYSDPTKLSKLHSVLIADEVYAKAVPADINEAATKYGLGKPSVNPPSASGLTSQQNDGAIPPAQVNPSEELPSSDGRSTLPEQPQNPDFGFQGVVDVVGKETPISLYNKAKAEREKRVANIVGDEKKKDDESAINTFTQSFARGSASLGESMANTPAFIYDIAAMPQNYIADKFDMPWLKVSSEKTAELAGLPENKVADYYHGLVEKSQKKFQDKYDKGITDYISDGRYKDAFGLLANQISESAPVTISLMMGNAAGVTPAASTIGSGVVFGAQKKKELDKEAPWMTEQEKLNASFMYGLTEGVFDQFGVTKIGSIVKNTFSKEGKDAAFKLAKDGFIQSYGKVLRQYFGTTTEEALSEAATQFAQNAIDKYSGAKPNQDLREGVMDAFIVGMGAGSVYGGAPIVGQLVQTKKAKDEQKRIQNEKLQLLNAVENPNLTDAAKGVLAEKIKQLNEQGAEIEVEERKHFETLPTESKNKLQALQSQEEEISTALEQPDLAEEVKVVLSDKLSEIEKEKSVLIEPTADESSKVETPTEATTIKQPNTTSNEGQNGNRSEANGSQKSAAEAENGNGKENASQNEEVSQGAEQAPNLPTKVFHATTATFEGLPKKGVEAKTAAFNEPSGVYYSTSEEGAKQATGKTEGQRIVEAEFTPKKPLVIEDALTDETYNAAYEAAQNQVREELGDEEYQIREEAEDVELGQKVSEAFSKILIDQGYDSVVNKGNGDVIVLDESVVAEPTKGEAKAEEKVTEVVEEKPAKKELTPEQVKRQDLRALMEDIADWNGMGKKWKQSNPAALRYSEISKKAKEHGLSLSRTMTSSKGASIKATDAKGNEVKLAAIKKLADEGKTFWSNDKYSAQEGDGKLEFYDNNGDQIDARSKEYGEAYNAYVKANAKAFSGGKEPIDIDAVFENASDEFSAMNDFADKVISSGNAFDIAANFSLIKQVDDNNSSEDSINPDWQIAQAVGSISEADFNKYFDKNWLPKNSTWVKKGDTKLSLDTQVQELIGLPEMAQSLGNLDEQDAINKIGEIIQSYPNGANSVPKGATTNYVKRAQEKFREITGIDLNDRTAAEFTALEAELGQGNLDAEAYWNDLTDEQKQELTDEQDTTFSEGERGNRTTKQTPSELSYIQGINGDVSAKAKEIIAAMDAVYDSKGQNFKARKTKLETTYGDEAKKAIDINRNFGKYYEAMRKLGAIIDKEC